MFEIEFSRCARECCQRGGRLIFIAFTVVVFLSACQTGGQPALSLEEAKQIATQVNVSFSPSPRSIASIEGKLDEQREKRNEQRECGGRRKFGVVSEKDNEIINKIINGKPLGITYETKHRISKKIFVKSMDDIVFDGSIKTYEMMKN